MNQEYRKGMKEKEEENSESKLGTWEEYKLVALTCYLGNGLFFYQSTPISPSYLGSIGRVTVVPYTLLPAR
jgi:hypothetical protein